MSKHASSINADALIRAANPLPIESTTQEIDAGLDRLRVYIAGAPSAVSRQPPRPRIRIRTRTRAVFGSGFAVAAAGVAFGVVNVLPAADGPAAVGTASAKQIIARTDAAMTGSGNGIVHVVVVGSTSDPFDPTGNDYTEESWSEQDAPNSFWDTYSAHGVVSYGTVIGEVDSNYYPSTNTIRTSSEAHVGEDDVDPTLAAVQAVEQAQTPAIPAGETISQAVENLLKTPGLTINENASVNGTPAIAISSGPPNHDISPNLIGVTLYVSPQTYKPIEEVMTLQVTAPNDPSQTATATDTTTFKTYEILPDGSVPVPDLEQEHPDAKVVTVGQPSP